MIGVEPTASRATIWRSNQLSYTHHILFFCAAQLRVGSCLGTPRGTRTPDLLLRRQLLYPAELLAQMVGSSCVSHCKAAGPSHEMEYRACLHFVESLTLEMERVMGIEPTRPAWKAGILAIELHPRITEYQPLDIITGGFVCQEFFLFSSAYRICSSHPLR